ncbi:hypothetical protein D3C87_125940 [compost metagenome]
MKFYILCLAMIMGPIISHAYGPTIGFERCGDSTSFALPTVDLRNHNPADCKDLSGHWVGYGIDGWSTALKKVVDIRFISKPETYAVCDQTFSCRGSSRNENAPPTDWYWFTGHGPLGLDVGGQIVCQGNVVDLLFRDYKTLYYRFHFEVLANGNLKYSMCGQSPFLLKKTGR